MKLTKEYRNQIIDRCVTARFAQADTHYLTARTALADALYNHAFGESEAIAKKLPPEWCVHMEIVYISSEGFNSRYYQNDEEKPNSALKLSQQRLMPAIITTQFTVDEEHPLYPQTQALLKIFQAIKTGKEELTKQLFSLLYSVTTHEKLLEVWPEGEPFFPSVTKKTSVPIPYDLTLSINRMMGICAEVAEAQ
jgi:hypothetical protein